MKKIGAIRGIDSLGRVVLPSDMRKHFDLNKGDKVEVFIDEDFIGIRKLGISDVCIFCGEDSAVFTYKGKSMCPKCLEGISRAKGNKH